MKTRKPQTLAGIALFACSLVQANPLVLFDARSFKATTGLYVPLPDASRLDVGQMQKSCYRIGGRGVFRPADGGCAPREGLPYMGLPGDSATVAGSERTLGEELAAGKLVVFDPLLRLACVPGHCGVSGKVPPGANAANAGGAPPQPAPQPIVTSFSGDPLAIVAGEDVALSWSSINAGGCSLSDSTGQSQTVASNGNLTASPTQTTIFTMTCSSAGNSDFDQLIVEVEPPPAAAVIKSFAASPSSIFAGSTSTLSWNASDASSCTVGGVATRSGGSGKVLVSPLSTRTYQLSCQGAAGSDSAKRTITVSPSNQNVEVVSLTAKPASISQGQYSYLVWESNNADYCLITNNLDRSQLKVAPTGNARFLPAATTQYALTCRNAKTKDAAQTTVSVASVSGKLQVKTFTASTSRFIRSGETQLIWTTADAGACWVTSDQGGDPIKVPLDGEAWFQVRETTTFKATCAAAGGQADALTTVEVFDEAVWVAGFEG